MAGNQGGETWHHADGREDMFEDATDVIDSQEAQLSEPETDQVMDHSTEVANVRRLLEDTERIASGYKEERDTLREEAAVVRSQLMALVSRGSEKTTAHCGIENITSPHEILSQCSQFVASAIDDRTCKEATLVELRRQNEELISKVELQNNVAAVVDRTLDSLELVVGQHKELSDPSFEGKMAHVESGVSMLLDHYNWYLYETNQLWQCLLDAGIITDTQVGFGPGFCFETARAELSDMKNKQMEIKEKIDKVETENRRLVEEVERAKTTVELLNSELGKVRDEVDIEKNRCANAKEKLSMAVSKGKALVQQRDLLKQSLADKSTELETSLSELREKSMAAEVSAMELEKSEILVSSLQRALSEREDYVRSIDELLSQTHTHEKAEEYNAVDKVKNLVHLVASQQETLFQHQTILQELEKSFSHFDFPAEVESVDVTHRSKKILTTIAYLQEAHSEMKDIYYKLDGIFSQMEMPPEFQPVDAVGRLLWLEKERNSLLDNLRDFTRLQNALTSGDWPKATLSLELEGRINWLKDSFITAQVETDVLQESIGRIKQAARDEIDKLTSSLVAELQEKEYMKLEMDDLMRKGDEMIEAKCKNTSEMDQIVRTLVDASGFTVCDEGVVSQSFSDLSALIAGCLKKVKEDVAMHMDTHATNAETFDRVQCLFCIQVLELSLCQELLEEETPLKSQVTNMSNKLSAACEELSILKEEKISLEKDLVRSEDKSTVLKEKLSLAIKKGKGLVQDKENMKRLLEEKNSAIEVLKLEVQQLESNVKELEDQINLLTVDLEQARTVAGDHHAIKDKHDWLEQFMFETKLGLRNVLESVDPINVSSDFDFDDLTEMIKFLGDFVQQCEQEKKELLRDLHNAKEEICNFENMLIQADTNAKLLEDENSRSKRLVCELEEYKTRIGDAWRDVQQNLEKAETEARELADQLSNVSETKKSLESSLKVAEHELVLLKEGQEKYLMMHSSTSCELEKMKEKFSAQSSSLVETLHKTKSLEMALHQAENNISLMTLQNNDFMIVNTTLEDELTNLKDEVEQQVNRLFKASDTIKSLQEALGKALGELSTLEDEKTIAEKEIASLKFELDKCMEELAGVHGSLESRSIELGRQMGDLDLKLNSDNLLTLFRTCFEKEYENLKNIDSVLREMNKHLTDKIPIVLEAQVITEDFTGNDFPQCNGYPSNLIIETDSENISLFVRKIVENFQSNNKVLSHSFESFHTFINGFIEHLLKSLISSKEKIVVSLHEMEVIVEKNKNLVEDAEKTNITLALLSNHLRTLESACINTITELDFLVQDNMLGQRSVTEFENLVPDLHSKFNEVSKENMFEQLDSCHVVRLVERLSSSTRNMQSMIKLFEVAKNETTEVVIDLERKLNESKQAYEKVVDERNILESKFCEVEGDFMNLQQFCEQIKLRVDDYNALEEKLKEKEAELLAIRDILELKEKEAEDSRVSTKKLETLFAKTRLIKMSYFDTESRDTDFSSDESGKLFHILDSVSEMQHKVDVLSNDKSRLSETIAEKNLQIERLISQNDEHFRIYEEYEKSKNLISDMMLSLQKIGNLFAANGIVIENKSPDLQKLMSFVEKQINILLAEVEMSKLQFQENKDELQSRQKQVDELLAKVRCFENSQLTSESQPEIRQERIYKFEGPSMPSDSEISEVDGVGPGSKSAITSVPAAAAHVRTMRKGSSDHLAINIDSETVSLMKREEIDGDKGHVFKSLNTSGLVPKQGKTLADKVDGLWVSGGRILMSRPRARLGVISYCIILHLWLLATVL